MTGALLNASCPMGGAGSRKGLSEWGPTLQRGAFRSSLDSKGKVQRRREFYKKMAPSGNAINKILFLNFDIVVYTQINRFITYT